MKKLIFIFSLICSLTLTSCCDVYSQSFGIIYSWRGLDVVYVSDIPYVYYFDDYGYRHRQPIPIEFRGEVCRGEKPRPYTSREYGYKPPRNPFLSHSGGFKSSTRITGRPSENNPIERNFKNNKGMKPQGHFGGGRR